jgi:anti-sigma B factor antagonist
MKFLVENKEKYTVVTLKAEKLDATISPEVKAVFVEQVPANSRNLIFNLGETRYCDSSGLSAILVGNRLCSEANGLFVLAGVPEHTQKLIKISQLDSVFTSLPTVEEAVDSIFMAEVEKELGAE